MENPAGAHNFGRMPSNRDQIELTEAEATLLRKLRTLQGGDYEAQYFDNKPTPNTKSLIEKMGNPTPLAVAAFGMTNTLLSFFLMNVRGIKELTFMAPVMLFTGGVTNFVVGMIELFIGNTFAYVIFGALGGYFISLGCILAPTFGIIDFYVKKADKAQALHGAKELRNALGLFNLCWGAMFFLFMIVSIRTNVFMIIIFACVTVTCVLSAIGDFQYANGHPDAKEHFDKIAGIFLLISSIPNWYLLFMMLVYSAGWKIKLYTGEIGPHAHGKKTE
jgi:succinate-acetate transporter protein